MLVRAAFKKGDVLVAIDAQDLTGTSATPSTVIEYLETIDPGAEVILSVERDDEKTAIYGRNTVASGIRMDRTQLW